MQIELNKAMMTEEEKFLRPKFPTVIAFGKPLATKGGQGLSCIP